MDIEKALAHPACERLRDFCAVGPAQRAAVEAFVRGLERAEPVAWRFREFDQTSQRWGDWRHVGYEPQGENSTVFEKRPMVDMNTSAPPAASAEPVADTSGDVSVSMTQGEPVPREGGSSYEASLLRNLLTRIHRDGGHYVMEHGIDKATEDADQIVAKLYAESRIGMEQIITTMAEIGMEWRDGGQDDKSNACIYLMERIESMFCAAEVSPAASGTVQVSTNSLQAALNYILHCGANQQERGLPHPQQQIISALENALSAAPKEGK